MLYGIGHGFYLRKIHGPRVVATRSRREAAGSIQEPYFFSKVLMPEEEEKEGRSEATVLLQGIWLLQQTRDYG
jgi:hypothetical protein